MRYYDYDEKRGKVGPTQCYDSRYDRSNLSRLSIAAIAASVDLEYPS